MAEQLEDAPKRDVSGTVRSKEDPKRYEVAEILKEFDASVPFKNLDELLDKIKEKNCDFSARVIGYDVKEGSFKVKNISKEKFLEAHKKKPKGAHFRENNVEFDRYKKEFKFKEGIDAFATDQNGGGGGDRSPIGQDFIPMLGGPFYKNLYFYDFIRQANAAFYSYNHDPFAHRSVQLLKEFTLGRGFRLDASDTASQALWDAFYEANNLANQFDQMATELSINGEVMWWWLPDNDAKIIQQLSPGQPVPKALLPRVRLQDATVFWEIVTQPEDITSVQYYVWVAPTQWQIYTGLQPGTNQMTPTSKFIFQTIPADQIDHYKVNCFSNEKRGRSDMFCVLGFLKRLRDSVNYMLVSLQKQAAWSIDTSIEGSAADIAAYISDQTSLGTHAPAGSEFVHTSKVKREFMAANAGGATANPAFEWAFSCVAAGFGIPTSYYGTHLSGGQTKSSAIISTEPVSKKFEDRQKVYEAMAVKMFNRLMEWAGMDATCEVTFPEIITQDRTLKLQDLAMAQAEGWFSPDRVAEMAAKEFNITDFDYEVEQKRIASTPSPQAMQPTQPLTTPPKIPNPSLIPSGGAVTGAQRVQAKKNG